MDRNTLKAAVWALTTLLAAMFVVKARSLGDAGGELPEERVL